MKKGIKVKMVNCSEAEKYAGKIWTTRSDVWICCGTAVISLEGKSGGFSISCLEEVDEDKNK